MIYLYFAGWKKFPRLSPGYPLRFPLSCHVRAHSVGDHSVADAVRRTEPALSSHPVDENGGTSRETVTARVHAERYLAEYAPLLDGSAAMRAIRAVVENIAD